MRSVRIAAERLGAGLVAGVAGTAAITASATIEMRMRGRPPSRAPLEVAERLLNVRAEGDGARLAAIAHGTTGVGLGALCGLSGATSPRSLFAASMLPELVLVPALTEVEAPWRWSTRELAISAGHHVAYALAAAAAFRAARM